VKTIRVRRTYSFTCLPEDLIRDSRVSDRAVRLWALLDRYARDKDAVSLTREALAADLGCSLDSVDRALGQLVAAGWLTHNDARGGRPREYQLWISTGVVRTHADNQDGEVRSHADNSPHQCGQPPRPTSGNRRQRVGEKSPPTPKADALGEPCAEHAKTLGRKHANCRQCGTAGRPKCDPQSPGRLSAACRHRDARDCTADWCECPHHRKATR
jgi:hypothetical protein